MVSCKAMDNLQLDLKTLLEHDIKMALNLVETSRNLVLDVQASHYWTKHSLEVFVSLTKISKNLVSLMDSLGPYWPEGKRIFKHAEAIKLWRTAAGLWSALPPEQKKFNERLARRRRERIMGEEIIQPEDLDQDTVRENEEQFALVSSALANTFNKLLARLGEIPDGIAPSEEILADAQGGQPTRERQGGNPGPATASPEQPQ